MYQTQDKILPLDKALRRINAWRVRSEAIVFTNGCFDLLHLGHVDYLEQAAREGERLVVGLNSNASVRRLKGAERPIQDEQARARILAALEFVDMVVVFEEDTPQALIEAIVPDVLVKGAEYAEEQIAGAGFVISKGGKVVRIPMLEGQSSSALAEKLKQL